MFFFSTIPAPSLNEGLMGWGRGVGLTVGSPAD
jgi:hypothetical protein